MATKPVKKTGAKKTAAKEKKTTKTTRPHAEPKSSGVEAKAGAREGRKASASKEVSAKRREGECSIKSCKREYRAKGYCRMHYKKWRQGAYGQARYKSCKESECFAPMAMNRMGYCEKHYDNYYIKGMAAPVVAPAEAPVKEKKEAAAG